MLKKFCVKCGRTTNNLSENGLCSICQPPQKRKVPKIIKVEYCPHCSFYKLRGGWQEVKNLKELISTILEQYFDDELSFEFTERDKQIFVTASSNKEELKTTIRLVNSPCKLCNRKHGGFYTTKIQLRGNKETLERNFQDLLNLFRMKSTRARFISQIKKNKQGYDLYVSNLTFAQTILKDFSVGKEVERKFSKELKSRKGGKYIYRYVLSVRVL